MELSPRGDRDDISCSSSTPAETLGPSRFRRALRWVIPAAILLTAVCAMSGNRVDTDLWGHVVYGRELLQDGALPETTTWSYVVQDHRWVNHENLAEIALAWTVDHFGPVGLSIGKLLLAIVVVTCMLISSRGSGAGWVATALTVVIAAETMEFHWHFRPQAITYACFAVMIAVLDMIFRNWRGEWRGWSESWRGAPQAAPVQAIERLNWLAVMPPLFLLWTNAHGGFAAGVAVLGAYLALRSVEAWCWWGRAAAGVLRRIAAFYALTVLATFLNPYGVELHTWLLYDVGAARPEISDWRPLDLFHDPDACGLWGLLVLAAVGLIGARRQRDWTQVLILSITLWQAISHCRHLVFFAILAGCWLARDLHVVLDRFLSDFQRQRSELASTGRQSAQANRSAGLATAGLLLWMGVVLAQLLPRLREIPVRRDWYPISAMQYLADEGLGGRVLVDFNWAQYAIMCFASAPEDRRSLVAVDGRLRTCYPWETLDVYLDFFIGDGGPDVRNRSPHAPPFEADRALRIGPPDLLLLSRQQWHCMEVIENHEQDWVLLYQDALAQVWGRRDRYDDPAAADYVPTWRRQLGEAPQLGALPWPALPRYAPQADSSPTRLALQD